MYNQAGDPVIQVRPSTDESPTRLVWKASSEIKEMVLALNEASTELLDRLDPILRVDAQPNAQPQQIAGKQLTSVTSVPRGLHGELLGHAVAVREVTERLRAIIQRLEI